MMLRTMTTTAVTLLVAAVVTTGLPTREADLTVHEWGTFTTVAGEDGRAVTWRPLDGSADLPCFVERANLPPKFSFSTTVRMETPVIYFYSPAALTVDVNVGFRGGLMTEYYPRPSANGSMARLSRDPLRRLQWNSVRIAPGTSTDFLAEDAPNHYYAARATDAAPLEVNGQREGFLFYRGVGGFELPLTARVVPPEDIEVANAGAAPIAGLMLFENRGGRIGFRTANRVTGRMTIAAPALDGDVRDVQAWLVAALVAEGLYPKEAAAMVATWRDTWFEEGTRIFYLVPRALIDQTLPLEVRPAPGAIQRVFVGRVEIATPAALEGLANTLMQGNVEQLAAHGRFLEPFTQRVLSRAMPAERAVMRASLDATATALRRRIRAVCTS